MTPRDRENHERFEEMAWAHVLGALDGEDTALFKAHLETGCPECLKRLPEFRATAESLLLAAGPASPPSGLRERVLAAAEENASRDRRIAGPDRAGGHSEPPVLTETEVRRSGPGSWWPGLALAASTLLAVLSWWALSLKSGLETARRKAAAAETRVAALESELARFKATAEQQASLIGLLQQPGSGLVRLASLAPAPRASGKVLWDRKGDRGWLWVSNLPPDPEGKDYQLWAIAGGKPVSAAVFSVSAAGAALLPLERFSTMEAVEAFAVTIEPAGGLPAPSGEMVLMGPVSG